MPELPEVENFKSYFRRTSLKKQISDVESRAKGLIKKITFDDFKKKLKGKSFRDARRRGKFLIVNVGGLKEKLIFHFGMTGNFEYLKQDSEENDFAKVVFKFKNGYELRWLNFRKLGKVYLVKDLDEVDLLKKMGPEPLLLSKEEFLDLLEKHKRKNIKSFLMSQNLIAGIGNIYSDEIMFKANMNPHNKIDKLTDKEKEELYNQMKKVLKKAIEIGPPQGKFPSSWLISYRKEGERCPICGSKIKKEKIAGRSAYFCLKCQK